MSVGSDLESVTSEVLGLVALGIEPLAERMTTRWFLTALDHEPMLGHAVGGPAALRLLLSPTP